MNSLWLIAFAVQWVLLLLLTALVAGILRYLNSIQERIAQRAPQVTRLDKGARISDFSLPDLNGQLFDSRRVIGGDQRVMLMVITAPCSSCEVLVSAGGGVDTPLRRIAGTRLDLCDGLACHTRRGS